jgi:cytidylate kinase
MAVLTVSRELGSSGKYLAQRVAEALEYHFVDKESIELVLRSYRLQTQFRDLYRSEPGLWTLFDRSRAMVLETLNEVILALAHHDNVVILGRGGYAVLSGFANVLNVRVQAPFEIRLPRVMDQCGIADTDRAEEFLRERDHLRRAFVESSYHVRWDDSSAFDLVIDTGKVETGNAIGWVVEAVEALEERALSNERTTNSIEVNSVVEATVTKLLLEPEEVHWLTSIQEAL